MDLNNFAPHLLIKKWSEKLGKIINKCLKGIVHFEINFDMF